MTTSRNEIKSWLEGAKASGATHLIISCDTFDYDDFPVPVMPGECVREAYFREAGKPMQKVMEVYALHLDLEAQLDEQRAFHFEGKDERRVTLEDVLEEERNATTK